MHLRNLDVQEINNFLWYSNVDFPLYAVNMFMVNSEAALAYR